MWWSKNDLIREVCKTIYYYGSWRFYSDPVESFSGRKYESFLRLMYCMYVYMHLHIYLLSWNIRSVKEVSWNVFTYPRQIRFLSFLQLLIILWSCEGIINTNSRCVYVFTKGCLCVMTWKHVCYYVLFRPNFTWIIVKVKVDLLVERSSRMMLLQRWNHNLMRTYTINDKAQLGFALVIKY